MDVDDEHDGSFTVRFILPPHNPDVDLDTWEDVEFTVHLEYEPQP